MRILLSREPRIFAGCVLLAIVAWFVAGFPLLRLPITLGYALYGVCLWRWPRVWLIAVPALLPVFDLAPWSGRFFFDEFDAFVLLTAGLLLLRGGRAEPVVSIPRALKWILALLIASYALSTLIWLWPPPPITPDSFANYDSAYNSLRIAKGFAWALLLLWPLRRAIAQDSNTELLLCFGLLLGLIGVGVISVYERWLFPGVLTLNTDYRTTASFSSMHTGDGHIDVWLATTIPLLGILFINRHWLLLMPLTIATSALALYALIATGSRGPIIAVIIAFGVGVLGLAATRVRQRRGLGAIILSVGAVGLMASIGLAIFSQTYLAQRFMQIAPDAAVRFNHWRDALALRDRSVATQLFGMGLGSFPLLHQQRATTEPRATRYRFSSEASEHFLTLWDGLTMYMGQVIDVTPQAVYQFSARVRTSEPNATLNVNLCELWMLASRNCAGTAFRLQALPNRWQVFHDIIHSDQVGSVKTFAGLHVARPTWLTLFSVDSHVLGVDIDSISLRDLQGRELVANGDFRHGADRWFWTVDNHLPWHTKNLVVNILFDQGWFGVLAVSLLLSVSLLTLVRRIVAGDPMSAVLLAAMTGFAVTGVTVSTFDQPRLALMFYLLCFVILSGSQQVRSAGQPRGAALGASTKSK